MQTNHENTNTDSHRETGADGSRVNVKGKTYMWWRNTIRSKTSPKRAEKWLEAAASRVGSWAENWSTKWFRHVLMFERNFIQQTNNNLDEKCVSNYPIMDISTCVTYWLYNSGEIAHITFPLITFTNTSSGLMFITSSHKINPQTERWQCFTDIVLRILKLIILELLYMQLLWACIN